MPREPYAEFARFYDKTIPDKWYLGYYRVIKSLFSKFTPKPRKILELASGTGRMLELFSTPNKSCINHYIAQYKKVYELNSLELKAPAATFGDSVENGIMGCIPLSESGSIQPLCIIIGV